MRKMMNEAEAREIKAAVYGADASAFTDPAENTAYDYFDWHRWIDSLDLDSGTTGKLASWLNDEGAVKLRAALHRIVDLTRVFCGKAVRIGRRVLGFIRDLVERFPTTCITAIIIAILVHMVNGIPYVGPVLAGIVQTAGLIVVAITFGFESLSNLHVK